MQIKKPTLPYKVEPTDLADYKAGRVNYIVDKFKVLPVEGQRLLLLTDEDELEATISHIRVLDGINTNYSIVSFLKADSAGPLSLPPIGKNQVLNLQTGRLESEQPDQ